MAVTFSYIGIETDPSKLVGSICSNPTNLDGRTENWHFRITDLTIPPQSNPVYPRILTDAHGGVWFNPSAFSQRGDNKCNSNNNWPMHVVPSVSGNTGTWDIYVAAYHNPVSRNPEPLPGIIYTLQLHNNSGLVEQHQTIIPGLRYVQAVNTPYRDSWSIKPNNNPDSVGTNCANPEDNTGVSTNWQFMVPGIDHDTEGAILLTDESGFIWAFNVDLATHQYKCRQDLGNPWPMGVSPVPVADPGNNNKFTWLLYVAPHPGTLPQLDSLFTVSILNINTHTVRTVTGQIFDV